MSQTNKLTATLKIALFGLILFLAFYNLSAYPQTWFDEGSHLHVPKTLVRYGEYADLSSEGFRYYGPTVGVGPTVFLPIALIFKIFGIGLLQARVVMALFLLAALATFYRLGLKLLGATGALLALALLLGSQAVNIIEYGRQVLGEVPGLVFLLLGLVLWFETWDKDGWLRPIAAGLFFGLAMVTKYQFVIIVVPLLGLMWLANLVYYRAAPQRAFLVPGIVAALTMGLWLGYQIVYLGPASAAENLAQFRTFTSGAALVFSSELMKRAVNELVSLKTFAGGFIPFAIISMFYATPRNRSGLQWGALFIIVAVNLSWYIVASISWLRYAFPGLVILSFVAARFFVQSLEGVRLNFSSIWRSFTSKESLGKNAIQYGLLVWAAWMVIVPILQTTWEVVKPRENTPQAMAEFMNRNVPQDSLVETWEPEMGFLTNHNYHYPPQILLNTAVANIWTGGASASESYDFIQTQSPDFILIGEFAKWVNMYPLDLVQSRYEIVTTIGAYDLYKKK